MFLQLFLCFFPGVRLQPMPYLWSSLSFLQSFPTSRGGGGVKFFEVKGCIYGATHVTNTFEQKPAFPDVEFIVFGYSEYIISLDFPGIVYQRPSRPTCQEFYQLMYKKWLSRSLALKSDILPENVSFSQDDVLNFFRRLGCLV